MARKSEVTRPTDEQILAQDTVRLDMAARYIGWSVPTLTNALRQERAPFGFATQNPKTETWAYNISPGLLVAYKRGTLPTYRLNEVIDLASEGVERILSKKMAGVQKITNALERVIGG